ncbi:unnamed protein product [Macrosiphum euphorbiae]|uniref:DUF4806 domain-containing protein n=1 Tax=Macrosiphum euphorbiae TaxID=13131 RepID=A0AAV0WYA8_9HEMI|nr:unnamed protein product [Macrosiphum euphorbiae]
MWSVVNFSKDNTVEVVPSFWVKDNKSAWPKKNAKQFIKQRLVPNNYDFQYLSIKKKMCKDLDDYFKASIRAKRSENTSNVSSSSYETNDEIRTRQKKATKREHYKMEKIQKNKAINKLPAWSPNSIDSLGSCMEIVEMNTNCDDEFNNPDNTQIDTPLSRNKMINDKILSPSNQSVKRKLDFKDRSLSPDLIPAAEVFNAVNTIEEVIYTSSSPFKVSMTNATTADNSALDILNKINRTTLNTWYEIKTMTERIENIEKCMTNKTNIFEIQETTLQGIDHVLQHILCNLPLKTEEDLTIFEEKLLDMQLKKKMVEELSRLARNNIGGTVRTILRFLFTDELLKEFSYKGQKKKKVFSVLATCSLIFESINKIGKFKNCNTIDVETPLKIFIAGAKFRINQL